MHGRQPQYIFRSSSSTALQLNTNFFINPKKVQLLNVTQRKQPNISKSDFSRHIVGLLQYINQISTLFDQICWMCASFSPPQSAFHWPLYCISPLPPRSLSRSSNTFSCLWNPYTRYHTYVFTCELVLIAFHQSSPGLLSRERVCVCTGCTVPTYRQPIMSMRSYMALCGALRIVTQFGRRTSSPYGAYFGLHEPPEALQLHHTLGNELPDSISRTSINWL